MKTITELRKEIYDYHRKNYAYIYDEWKWYSYRKFKAKLYMETSAVLVYLFMKMHIKPNAVTIVYAVMGILAGVFFAIPLNLFILAGIILFYFRGILDWSDGLLARETNQTSITGAILDSYGALTGWVALWVGLGLYVANKPIEGIIYLTPNLISITSTIFANFIYLIPVIPAIFAMDIMMFTRAQLFASHITKDIQNSLEEKPNQADPRSIYAKYGIEKEYPIISKIVRSFYQIFEHNARTVDVICFIILFELFFPIFISWIVFFVFLLWQIILFVGIFYMVAKGGWVEKELQDKIG